MGGPIVRPFQTVGAFLRTETHVDMKRPLTAGHRRHDLPSERVRNRNETIVGMFFWYIVSHPTSPSHYAVTRLITLKAQRGPSVLSSKAGLQSTPKDAVTPSKLRTIRRISSQHIAGRLCLFYPWLSPIYSHTSRKGQDMRSCQSDGQRGRYKAPSGKDDAPESRRSEETFSLHRNVSSCNGASLEGLHVPDTIRTRRRDCRRTPSRCSSVQWSNSISGS